MRQTNKKADANAKESPKQARQPSVLVLDLVKGFASAKQQRNAPNACKTYNGVDNAREQRGLSAADPCNDVELKQSDAAPVESTNDGQNQRNAIQYHHFVSFAYCGIMSTRFVQHFLKFRLLVVCAVVKLLCTPPKKRNFVQKNAHLLTNVCN